MLKVETSVHRCLWFSFALSLSFVVTKIDNLAFCLSFMAKHFNNEYWLAWSVMMTLTMTLKMTLTTTMVMMAWRDNLQNAVLAMEGQIEHSPRQFRKSATLMSSSTNQLGTDVIWDLKFKYVPHLSLLPSNRPADANFAPPVGRGDHSEVQDNDENDEESEEKGTADHLLPDFDVLSRTIKNYQGMMDSMIRELSLMHESASRTESILFPHSHRNASSFCDEDPFSLPKPHLLHHNHNNHTNQNNHDNSDSDNHDNHHDNSDSDNHDNSGSINHQDQDNAEPISLSSTSPWLSCRLQRKIGSLALTLEQNMFALQDLLKPFPLSLQLPSHPSHPHPTEPAELHDESPSQHHHDNNMPPAWYIPPHHSKHNNADNDALQQEEEPYEAPEQIIAHITRDWGQCPAHRIRAATHSWILQQLWQFHDRTHGPQYHHRSSLSPVLIPGAGMGRLAHDIAFANRLYDPKHHHHHHHQHHHHSLRYYFPFRAEAMDNSLVMAAAAYHILRSLSTIGVASIKDNQQSPLQQQALQQPTTKQWTIYPFASDAFTNEITSHRRWDTVAFPEQSVIDQFQSIYPSSSSSSSSSSQADNHADNVDDNNTNNHVNNIDFNTSHHPSLSYTIADFVSTYASKQHRGQYGSIVTCFFIDTATNIYEYIITIRNLLRNQKCNKVDTTSKEKRDESDDGGIWINVGPVQWHRNAKLRPTVDELRDIIELSGFDILHWEIETALVPYRHPEDMGNYGERDEEDLGQGRFTRTEAYRPLKFIAVKRCDSIMANDDDGTKLDDVHYDHEEKDLIYLLDEVRYATGRKTMMDRYEPDEDDYDDDEEEEEDEEDLEEDTHDCIESNSCFIEELNEDYEEEEDEIDDEHADDRLKDDNDVKEESLDID